MKEQCQKVEYLSQLLQAEPTIHETTLRETCFYSGCTDNPGIRAGCWRLLLGLQPYDKRESVAQLKERRSAYWGYVENFVCDKAGTCEGEEDHPLNPKPTSRWNEAFYQDAAILDQINKDCKRLYPSINFFQQHLSHNETLARAGPSACLRDRISRPVLSSKTVVADRFGMKQVKAKATFNPSQQLRDQRALSGASNASVEEDTTAGTTSESVPVREYHWEVCQRILFIYHKLHRSVSYIQGMNELLGPIYYVLARDPDFENFAKFSEPDAFFCFSELLSNLEDFYIKQLDGGPSGIRAWLADFMSVLKHCSPSVHRRLADEFNIRPEHFAFRWITILFSQEFRLPEILRLWDSLFSAPRGLLDFLTYVAVAYVLRFQEIILHPDCDYARCLQTLSGGCDGHTLNGANGDDTEEEVKDLKFKALLPIFDITELLSSALTFSTNHADCCSSKTK